MTKNSPSADLPVLAYRQAIETSVRENRVTIVTAETGAGKSTQVPRFLAEAGYHVVVTQPRRLAARTLAQRVAREMKTRLGDRVGYRTAHERADSSATEVLFCTDGLQLVRELSGAGGTGGSTVLVLDEVHEWNLNMEVLVAWVRQRVEAGDDLRVVLMSATLDAERLASYFGGAPVIEVPGRVFPVEKRHSTGSSVGHEAAELAKAGRSILVFQPGKREIGETVARLRSDLGDRAFVLPLHGSLEPAEQQACFEPPPAGKVKVVVATNVAQTAVTIPDIDAVVDSGVERRIELRDGIEGLHLLPISQADCAQRAGRAGRTKPGVYVLCSETSMTERPEFPRAEVLRSRLDQMVLRLAVQGFDATALKFFHQPETAALADAKRALVALGAMSSDGSVSKTGRRMARFPVSVGFARMLIEAERNGVVEQVATIAACLEAGDIRARAQSKFDEPAWKKLTQETQSDLLALLDVYNAGKGVKGGRGKSKADAMREQGIFAKDFFRAGEIRRKLLNATGRRLASKPKKFASKDEEREAVLRACVAGMVDHLYAKSYNGYRNGAAGERELARESVVRGRPDWLVGLPFDISGKGRRGRTFVLNLLGMATAVDPKWLLEVAPHLAETKTGRPAYDSAKDVVVSTTERFFNGQKVGSETVADGEHPEAAQVFARWLSGKTDAAGTHLDAVVRANAERQERARQLNTRTGEETFKVFSQDEVFERFVAALSGARRVAEVDRPEALALPALDDSEIKRVLREQPDSIEILGERLVVEYKDSYGSRRTTPRVKLSEEMVKAASWNRLPDEGVRLPGGRSVEVVVSFGWSTALVDTDIPRLKVKVREHLNREQWERFVRPAIEIPDPSVEGSVIPFETAVYGQCIETGAELKAHGTLVINANRWYESDPWFRAEWFRDLLEAHNAADASAVKLAELMDHAKAAAKEEGEKAEAAAAAEAEKEAARSLAEAAQEELHDLKDATDRRVWRVLEEGIWRRAEDAIYFIAADEVEELRRWATKTEALIAEVKEALVAAGRGQEEAKAKEEAERLSYAVLLNRSWNPPTLDLCREVDAFVRDCIALVGGPEALAVFYDESGEAYGRARRTASLKRKFPGVDHRGLDWAAGRDIELCHAWAEHVVGKVKEEKSPKPATDPPRPPPAAASEKKVVASPPASQDQVVDAMAALRAKFGGGASKSKKRRR